MATKMTFEKKDIEANKLMAAIGYIWILCLIPLLLKRDSKFAQAHAKQGLVLFIVEVVGSIVPILGWLLVVAAVVAAVIGFVKAIQGEFWPIPGVEAALRKLNF